MTTASSPGTKNYLHGPRLACNSNIVALMPRPIGQYSFKYNLKDAQIDNLEAYSQNDFKNLL
jgi:hypothetical protein